MERGKRTEVVDSIWIVKGVVPIEELDFYLMTIGSH